MRNSVLILLLYCFSPSFAQNLIPNYSFENYTTEQIRKDGLLTIYFNQGSWKSFGSIDLFSRVNETVPCNSFGKACPVSGSAYMGMNAAYPREIAQTLLKKTLEKNKTYSISFYISPSFKTDAAVKLRALFSDTLVVNFSGFVFLPKTIALNECPTEIDNWKKVHALYKARGGENYLCIGNFDEEYDLVKSDKHKWHDTYYFIDDVVLKEISNNETCDCNSEIVSEFFTLENEKCRCAALAIKNKLLPINLIFETGKYNLDQNAISELDSLAMILNSNKSLKITINGYADVDGTEPDNNNLSLNRAKAVAEYFFEQKIEKERISFKGYGSSGTAENEEIKSRNRRVEIKIEE
jgi:outer membrane protein OmpA-like peptidoglycan-associated protein